MLRSSIFKKGHDESGSTQRKRQHQRSQAMHMFIWNRTASLAKCKHGELSSNDAEFAWRLVRMLTQVASVQTLAPNTEKILVASVQRHRRREGEHSDKLLTPSVGLKRSPDGLRTLYGTGQEAWASWSWHRYKCRWTVEVPSRMIWNQKAPTASTGNRPHNPLPRILTVTLDRRI